MEVSWGLRNAEKGVELVWAFLRQRQIGPDLRVLIGSNSDAARGRKLATVLYQSLACGRPADLSGVYLGLLGDQLIFFMVHGPVQLSALNFHSFHRAGLGPCSSVWLLSAYSGPR